MDGSTWLLVLLTLLSLVTNTNQNVRQKRQLMADQPRIITESGHLIFQSGQNHNITFRSGSGGVFIDNFDLKNTVTQTLANKNNIANLQSSLGSGTGNVTHRLSTLEGQLTQLTNLPDRVNAVAATVDGLRVQTMSDQSSINTRISQLETNTGNVQLISNLQNEVSGLRTRVQTLESSVNSESDSENRNFHQRNQNSDQGGSGGGANRNRGGGSNRRLRNRISALETAVRTLQQLLTTNECLSNPCMNGGTCVDMYNGYFCRCPSNWQGPQCNEDVNECYVYAGTDLGCQNGATCSNTQGSFSCHCATDWHGIHCSERHDDCATASHQELCGQGTCVNMERTREGQPRYTCICANGWTTSASDPACTVDIDECATGRHCSADPAVQCINIPGSFVCAACPQGYTGNGYTCSDINECTLNNGGCSTAPMVQCINIRGSRECGPCPAGYQGNGVTCSYVGFCSVNNGGCHSLATCSEGGNARFCICLQGYVGSGVGPNGCQLQSHAGACASNPCQNGAVCTPNGVTAFTCSCTPGHTGPTCSEAVDACASSPCLNNGICLRQTEDPFYICQCSNDFTGANCELQQDECGGNLNGETGSLRYPRLQRQYDHLVSCAWVITTSPNKILKIDFLQFSTEHSTGCAFDFLEIHDGSTASSHLIGKFCGSNLPNGGSINSTHNQLYFWFKSDVSFSGDGFHVQWTSHTPTCGGFLNNTNHGTLRSPGYPQNYPHDRDCVWIIAVSPGSNIMIQFAHLALEYHINCNYDYLEIRDGETDNSPLLNRFCSSSTPAPVLTTGPYAYVWFHSDSSDSAQGFHITYAAHTDDDSCGGLHFEAEGVISTPGYPAPYTQNGLCVWVIRLNVSTRVHLTIRDLDFGQSNNCALNSLTIRDGFDEMAPVLRSFCDSAEDITPVTSSNIMNIEFRTGLSFSGKFRAQWVTVCGGIYTESEGRFQSPNWPHPYSHNQQCEYKILVSDMARVLLQFIHFSLDDDEECAYNYIEIFDGVDENAPMIGTRLCGLSIPNQVMSTGNSMFLKFFTDISVHSDGFQAVYTSVESGPGQCGGVFRANTSIISSPGHPNEYPHGINCTWYIFAPPGFLIRLTFNEFHFEQSYGNSRCYDYVEVYDDSTIAEESSLGRFCGINNPGTLTSTNNVMVVFMETDIDTAREGFTASYTIINAATVCGLALTASNGVVSSPNYPNQYPHNRQCEWTITVHDGYQIQLNITDIDIIQLAHCRENFLEIRNGGDRSSPLIQKLCGTTIPADPIISYSNKIYLLFKTTSFGNGRGFQIEYMSEIAGCGGDTTAPTGGIISPNYPHPYTHNMQCFYTITVSQGSSISLFFVDFDLEDGACNYDHLVIREGGSNGHLIQTLCGSNLPSPITITSNRLWLAFTSDFIINARGFRLQYHSSCNNHLTGNSGAIESPNFPNPYSLNSNCTWVIQVSLGSTINVSFASFDLTDTEGCATDYLQIRDGANSNARELMRACGSSIPEALNSTGNILWIKFVSNQYFAGNGFRLEWIKNGCGGTLSGNTGTITSPNYPHTYPHNTVCEWLITMDTGNSIEITITHFDVEGSTNCRWDALEIYAGSDRQGPRIGLLCHSESRPQTIHTTGGTAFLYFRSDSSINGTGFSLTYRALSQGCGGHFTTRTATIHSINYPNNYEHNTECEWIITVAAGHVVDLTITDFQFEDSNNCSFDSLKIYDGANSSGTLIATLCGQTMPIQTVYKSNGNQMFLRMSTDDNISSKGFKATYTTGCGGTLNADVEGEIISPGYPNRYPRNTQCVWIISSSILDRRVSLMFTHINMNSDCTSEYVTVNDGITPVTNNQTDNLQNAYCGNSIPATITSEGSALTVVFQSSIHSYGNGFRAVYFSSISYCGAELTAESGRFMSPNYPNGYPVDIECVWIIKVPPGNQIQITFPNFQLDPLGGINDDYVEIRSPNVSGSLVGRWIGSDAPSNLTSYFGAWVKFRSNEDTTAAGFTAEFSSLYGGELVGDSGQIASPRYPLLYPGNVNYRWTILVSQDKRIRITFDHFSLEPSYGQGQCFDFVKLLDGSEDDNRLLGQFCGNGLPGPLYSETNQITVIFVTDSTDESDGFLLSWLAVAPDDIPMPSVISPTQLPGCGGFLQAEEIAQNLTFPGFQGHYLPNLYCTWTITAPEGYRVVANITRMDLYSSFGCYGDYIVFGQVHHHYFSRPYCTSNSVGEIISSAANILNVMFRSNSFNEGNGFSIDYKIGCGGTLSSPEGVIKSPNFPNNYPANQSCSWLIRVLSGKTIQITFSDGFNIADSGECNNDYVQLLNGDSPQSPPLYHNGSSNINGSYCGVTPPQVLETSSNTLYVNFVSNGLNEGPGFSLAYRSVSVACGGHLRLTYNANSGYFQSPNFPGNYPHNVECVWVIFASVSRRIQVNFVNFSMESNTRCAYDFIEFRDGGTINAQKIGNSLCGTILPGTVVSTGNVLYARFKTDNSAAYTGFKAYYTFATCGGRITANSGFIQSPNYPHNYDNGADCEWNIVGSIGHYLIINITNFSLQFSENCTEDSLVIRDGNATDTILFNGCGYISERSILTSYNVAYIRFKSDSTVTNSGFKIVFQTSLEECGGLMNLPSGTITSPEYPNPYLHNRICEWKITVPLGRRVTFTFNALSLEGYPNYYCHDYVELVNGIISGSPRLGQYCGSTIPAPIESSGNTMKVTFKTDSSINSNGFSATYTSDREAECGGLLTESAGNITSPEFGNGVYHHNSQCLWNLHNRLNNGSIVLYFVSLALEAHSSCYYDYVEIREGTDVTGLLLGKFCDASSQGELLVIPTTDVWIRFRTDLSVASLGFLLAYEFTECGGLMGDPQGVIVSPNSNVSHLHSTLACAWKITAPEGTRIQIRFTDFLLDNSSSSCDSENLLIQNGGLPDSPTAGNFCGTSLPQMFTSMSNELRLTFKSTLNSNYGRFRLEYSFDTEGCGILYHSNEGTFSTPRYPRSYPHNIQCQWDINVDLGYIITLNFIPPFDLQADDCLRDYVEVFDAFPNGTLTSLGRWCHNVEPPQQRSSSNRLLVVFQSDATTNGNGFSARWNSECGGNFTETSGVLVSPGYPNKYPNNAKCYYTISPGSQHQIALRFTDLDLESYHDFIIVSQGNASTLPNNPPFFPRHGYGYLQHLATLSGNHIPNVLQTKGQMLIRFITDGSIQKKGFRAEYQSEECGGVFTDFGGTIATPHQSFGYGHNMNCSWNITVEPNRVIRFKFNSLHLEHHYSCGFDSVSFYDGPDTNSNRIGQFCGQVTSLPENISSTGNQMYITIITDVSVARPGFSGYYWTTYGPNQGCGGVLRQPEGTIRSVDGNGDGRYEDYLDCEWLIYADINNIVTLTFSGMDIQASENCELDSIKIYDGTSRNDPLISNLCNQTFPRLPILSSSNTLFVVFHTDGTGSNAGFNATFAQSPSFCGGAYNVTNTAQILTSPNYPNSTTVVAHCSWFLDSLDSNKNIRITFTDFQLQTSTNCESESLTIRDQPMGSNGQKVVNCGELIPHHFESKGQMARITYFLSNPPSRQGFKLTYQIADCNHNISMPSGRITSPRYPEVTPVNLLCIIHVTSPENTTLAFYFRSFKLEHHTQCQFDYLEIKNSSSPKLCGTSLPNPIFMSGNEATLELKTDYSVQYPGYDITFISSTQGVGCGGNVTHIPSGVFTSPGYPNHQFSTTTCSWYVTPPVQRTLFWKITFMNTPTNGTNCEVDYLALYSGLTDTGPLLQRFCDNPQSFLNPQTIDGPMLVQYVSTGNGTAPVFKFEFGISVESFIAPVGGHHYMPFRDYFLIG